jgi:hypothetical protein
LSIENIHCEWILIGLPLLPALWSHGSASQRRRAGGNLCAGKSSEKKE